MPWILVRARERLLEEIAKIRRVLAISAARIRSLFPGLPRLTTKLGKCGRKVYSQNDEDGILEYLFTVLRIPKGFFVEIGVGPPYKDGQFLDVETSGLECNCRLLKQKGWKGVFVDGANYPSSLEVRREFITAEDINESLRKLGVPADFDMFSLDIDGNDYWVWKALEFEPAVVVIEYNSNLGRDESKTIAYDPNFDWGKSGCTKYYGASLLALNKLGIEKGYTLVYANGVNAFFVHSARIGNSTEFEYNKIYRYRDVHEDAKGDERWVTV